MKSPQFFTPWKRTIVNAGIIDIMHIDPKFKSTKLQLVNIDIMHIDPKFKSTKRFYFGLKSVDPL